MTLTVVQKVAVWVLPVVLAITLHEVAHGWAALRLGDRTAQALGRLSLNPLRHVDPVGTLLVPGALWMLGGLILGWARPVPVDGRKLRNPRRDMAWVALAGPAANLAMGAAWALVARLGLHYDASLGVLARPMVLMGVAGIFINTILLVVNLLPIPPLDGGRVLVSVLPRTWANRVGRIEPYGLLVVLVLLGLQLLGVILEAPFQAVSAVLLAAAGMDRLFYHLHLSILLGVS